MRRDDARMAAADRLGRLHVVVLLRRQHGAAHDARVAGNDHHGDGDHRVRRIRSQDRDDRQGQHQARDRLDGVHHALQDQIHPPLAIAADQADEHARRRPDADREQSHPQRDPAAVDDAAEDVAADVVGAERVIAAGRRQSNVGLRGQRVVRRQHVGEERGEHEHSDQRRRHRAERLAAEGVPQQARAADLVDRGRLERRDARRHRGHRGRAQRYRIRGSSHA